MPWSTWSMTIGGVNYTNYIRTQSINITESLQANGRSMSCEGAKLPGGPARPVAGAPIIFTVDGVREFAGRVAKVSEIQPLTTSNFGWRLECVDWTVDLDRHLVTLTLDEDTAGSQILAIMSEGGGSISGGNVDAGPKVAAVEMVLETASSAISRVAESVQYQWFVDYNRSLNFFFVDDRAAPVGTVDLDVDVTTYYDAVVDDDWTQVKNRVYITGAQIKSSYEDHMSWTVTGDDRFFALGYAPWAIDDTKVYVNGMKVGPTGLDSIDSVAGDGKDGVFLCLDNHGIRFGDNMPPGSKEKPAVVDVDYRYAIDAILTVENGASIARLAAIESAGGIPGDGVHEYRFEVPAMRIEKEDAVMDYANLLLARYSDPLTAVSFTSRVQGWQVGQNFRVKSTIRSLDSTVYVHNIKKRVMRLDDGSTDGFYFEYTVDALSSPFPG